MQDANTKTQMGTARRCLEQITNIKAIAREVKSTLQAVSEAERDLKVTTKAFNEINNVVWEEHRERITNASQAFVRAGLKKDFLEFIPERTWIKSPSKGPQSYIEALVEARNSYAEAEKVFADAFCDLGKTRETVNYYKIADRMREANTALQSEKDGLKQAKELRRKVLSSLKPYPPTLQGRCIETICGALLPTCTETDLESLPVPTALRSDITTFCDCLYLIQSENISV